ncbi:NDP-hexose 2,3-dehydratase family protein, partial [bacterium]|nr:NDP-hexose 2,3-dehydratase family protein [bacterium]
MLTITLDMQKEASKLKRSLEKLIGFPRASTHLDLLISSMTEHNPFNSTAEISDWLNELNTDDYFNVEQISLIDLRKWYFDPYTGDLAHATGGFFAIRGLEVSTNIGPVRKWTQPIIDQPKIGVLGIITKKIDGILYFLMQAKAEPGNINTYQLAPTVQATRSNYMRLHGGDPTPYVEYFLNGKKVKVLFDQHQSEQGARFYRKRNRNIIIQIPEDEAIPLKPHYRWMTLGQIKRSMLKDNTVNMDARSVISLISYCPENKPVKKQVNAADLQDCLNNSPLVQNPISDYQIKLLTSDCANAAAQHSIEELLRGLSRKKFEAELDTRLIPLHDVNDWMVTSHEISHKQGFYFSIIGTRVESTSREVPVWDQPIIKQRDSGIVGFITKEIKGVIHFLVQLKMESGNIDLLGMAPTVQCITGSYDPANLPPYVAEMLEPSHTSVVFDTMQSEEGGRFYREENRNLLLAGDEHFPIETPPMYLWVSLYQLKQFLI